MKTYLITYDLKYERAGYEKAREKLIAAIKALGDTIHIASTTYMAKTNLVGASAIYEKLKICIDSNDNLFIVQLCRDHYGVLPQERWTWISAAPKCC